jgi:glycosyltransferase involved in cell wall biosynthesis
MIKNHRLFVEAINYVIKNTNKKIRAFIVGDGDYRKIVEDQIKNYNIDFIDWKTNHAKASITFTSWIKNVDYVMAGVDIIALTSLDEGTPVSLIEAQAADKPIVTTNVGGIEDVVLPDKTALLSPNNDMQSFANNLLSLVENDNLRANLGSNGWNFVSKKYHYTRLIDDIDKLYKSILYR